VKTLWETFAPVKFPVTPIPLVILFYVIVHAAFIVVAILTRKRDSQIRIQKWQILVCASLALVPVLILYGVSVGTSIHIFATRHRIEAVSGIALGLAMVFTLLKSRAARLLFCLMLVATAAYQWYSSSGEHLYSWKGALEIAEKNASVDNAPVLICSDFPESDSATMPVDAAKESPYFTQLSY